MARKLFSRGDHEGALRYGRLAPESLEAQNIVRAINLLRRRTVEQSEEWSFARKYFVPPWDLADVCLGVAYAVRKYGVLERLRPPGVRILRIAERLEPESPDVSLLQGWCASGTGDYEGAVAGAKKAIELAPQYAKAWIALGFFAQ